MSDKNAQNEGCSSIKTKLNEPMIKHQREKKLSEETISTLKADLLASRERNKGFKQARITIAGELSQTLDELNFKKKQTEEQVEFTDVLKPKATVAILSSQTNTSSNTKIEEKLKEPEEKIEKDKLDTQALQERNQDVIRNKNQRIASLNEELIELKEDKTQDNDDSSEQQKRLEELQENYDKSMADNKVFQSHR